MIIFEWLKHTLHLQWFSLIIYEKIHKKWYFHVIEQWMRDVTLKWWKMCMKFSQKSSNTSCSIESSELLTRMPISCSVSAPNTQRPMVSIIRNATIVNRMFRYVSVYFDVGNGSILFVVVVIGGVCVLAQ